MEMDKKLFQQFHNRIKKCCGKEIRLKNDSLTYILDNAFPLIQPGSDMAVLTDSWFLFFIDKYKYVTNKELLDLGAKILACHINGTFYFSKRTLNIFSLLEKWELVLLKRLNKFSFVIENIPTLVLLDLENKIYTSEGIGLSGVLHLQHIGIISLSSRNGIYGFKKDTNFNFNYGENQYSLKFINEQVKEILVGIAVFTEEGKEAMTLFSNLEKIGFLDYVKNEWKDTCVIEKL